MIWSLIVLLALIMAIGPRLSQMRTLGAKDQYFKLIKLKKSAFLFSAAEGQSVTSHGITIPMLFVQIFGYVMACTAIVVSLILYLCSISDTTIAIVAGGFCFLTIIVTIITGLITEKVADLRESRNYKPKA